MNKLAVALIGAISVNAQDDQTRGDFGSLEFSRDYFTAVSNI